MMEGMVANIQRFSIHDGPGIRTTVFLKGCSLSCFWCHNPETISPLQQIQFFKSKCIGCGVCSTVCPVGGFTERSGIREIGRELCIHCGKCVENCPSEALITVGKCMSVEEVMSVLVKDREFFEHSKGGVTFSGGEPMLQNGFLASLLIECKKSGLHTAVETAGNVKWECFTAVLPYTDLFLYDLKLLNEAKHIKYIGKSNRLILENLRNLSDGDAKVIIRIPIIPGINDLPEDLNGLAEFILNLKKIEAVELIPFHSMAKSKYESLGKPFDVGDIKTPGEEWMENIASLFKQKGLQVTDPKQQGGMK